MQGRCVANSDSSDRAVRGAKPRRSAARDSLFLSATIARLDEAPAGTDPVRVRNLSSIGMMADHDGRYLEGDQVMVVIRGIGAVKGKVAWVRPGRMGVAFDDEVDPKLARKPIKVVPRKTPSRPIRPLF